MGRIRGRFGPYPGVSLKRESKEKITGARHNFGFKIVFHLWVGEHLHIGIFENIGVVKIPTEIPIFVIHNDRVPCSALSRKVDS